MYFAFCVEKIFTVCTTFAVFLSLGLRLYNACHCTFNLIHVLRASPERLSALLVPLLLEFSLVADLTDSSSTNRLMQYLHSFVTGRFSLTHELSQTSDHVSTFFL